MTEKEIDTVEQETENLFNDDEILEVVVCSLEDADKMEDLHRLIISIGL